MPGRTSLLQHWLPLRRQQNQEHSRGVAVLSCESWRWGNCTVVTLCVTQCCMSIAVPQRISGGKRSKYLVTLLTAGEVLLKHSISIFKEVCILGRPLWMAGLPHGLWRPARIMIQLVKTRQCHCYRK